MKKVLLLLWQAPQVVLGLLVVLVLKARRRTAGLYVCSARIGVSFGPIIVLYVGALASEHVLKHEQGHSKQSLMLGPLYLPTVGIASLSLNLLSRLLYSFGSYRMMDGYYMRWPENWADKLGGVKR